MRILLTNDDGIHGVGLLALVKELYGKHDIMVVAPKVECSGNSHSLIFGRPIAVTKTTIPGYEDVPAYFVDGTPADCARIAYKVLIKEDEMPDVVLSGINRGPNLGVNILWSGTIAAAVQATLHGARALAFSHVCFTEEPEGFVYGAQFARRLAEMVDQFDFPIGTILNVNYPNLNEVTPKEVKVTKMSNTNWFGGYTLVNEVDENTKEYRVKGDYQADDGPGDDTYEIRQGNISITPLWYEYTDLPTLENITFLEDMEI
ncbi:MAG: 5'/3'-nucleotidase SurE [Christensenellaceae bacterium]|jgi:5'-nucleotidase